MQARIPFQRGLFVTIWSLLKRHSLYNQPTKKSKKIHVEGQEFEGLLMFLNRIKNGSGDLALRIPGSSLVMNKSH